MNHLHKVQFGFIKKNQIASLEASQTHTYKWSWPIIHIGQGHGDFDKTWARILPGVQT